MEFAYLQLQVRFTVSYGVGGGQHKPLQGCCTCLRVCMDVLAGEGLEENLQEFGNKLIDQSGWRISRRWFSQHFQGTRNGGSLSYM